MNRQRIDLMVTKCADVWVLTGPSGLVVEIESCGRP